MGTPAGGRLGVARMNDELAALYANLPPESRAKVDALIFKLLNKQQFGSQVREKGEGASV